MRIFDDIDPMLLEQRDWHLWMLALAMILILASGLALLMYPAVFSSRLGLSGPSVRAIFFGFCGLSILLVGYLMERQIVIRHLRNRVLEEERSYKLMVQQASTDLLETLPGLDHFRDRLAMEFRRAVNIQQPLSLLMVGLRASRGLVETGTTETAWGDAARSLIRRLRREDSIYLFRPGVFGIILPGLDRDDAHQVVERLADGLTDASGASARFSFEMQVVNYPEHVSAAHEMERQAETWFQEKAPEKAAAM